MELSSISQKAADEVEKIAAARAKGEEQRAKWQRIAELRQGIETRQQPLINYAKELINTNPKKEFQHGFMLRFYASPLVKVGDTEDGSSIFVQAREIHESATHDIDGYPDFRQLKLSRWEFIAAVGAYNKQGESNRHGTDSDEIRYLGRTLEGEGVFGRDISVERLYPEEKWAYTAVNAAEQADVKNRELCDNVAETIELIRQSLADEELNPRSGAYIPESLI